MNRFRKLLSNQKVFIVGTVVLAGMIGFGAMYVVANNRQSATVAPTNCEGVCVNLLGDKASPNTLAVIKGSYVTFNSADGKSHELTLGDPASHGHSNAGSFESGVFKSDESFKVQFKEEGTYKFTDKMNPGTTIIVVVYTEGKDYKI